MWYEVAIPAAIIVCLTSIPSLLMPLVQELRTGNKYYKDTDNYIVRHNWFRDLYLTGNPLKPTPIDAIPDLPDAPASEK